MRDTSELLPLLKTDWRLKFIVLIGSLVLVASIASPATTSHAAASSSKSTPSADTKTRITGWVSGVNRKGKQGRRLPAAVVTVTEVEPYVQVVLEYNEGDGWRSATIKTVPENYDGGPLKVKLRFPVTRTLSTKYRVRVQKCATSTGATSKVLLVKAKAVNPRLKVSAKSALLKVTMKPAYWRKYRIEEWRQGSWRTIPYGKGDFATSKVKTTMSLYLFESGTHRVRVVVPSSKRYGKGATSKTVVVTGRRSHVG
ncbi:hypothetical protein [Rarobacter incanus]|uniref:Uncharacterized protein n=1 Tax=Rarobacter incanus TaxID=153494 RepID=A0A542SPN4_9MICO|nr:hypothetical protein [Rarobacter incanus]TQK76579.1 hypothetical protein FB389_1263 [Rarobacter incanus]